MFEFSSPCRGADVAVRHGGDSKRGVLCVGGDSPGLGPDVGGRDRDLIKADVAHRGSKISPFKYCREVLSYVRVYLSGVCAGACVFCGAVPACWGSGAFTAGALSNDSWPDADPATGVGVSHAL